MPTEDTSYQSNLTGAEIDNALGQILDGTIAQAVENAQTAADRAEQAAVKTPYIGNNNTWMVWDFQANEYVDTEISALGEQGEVGPAGPPGPQGTDGAIIDLEAGIFAMTVNSDGHLIVSVNVDEEIPPLEIDEQGHLIYKITS